MTSGHPIDFCLAAAAAIVVAAAVIICIAATAVAAVHTVVVAAAAEQDQQDDDPAHITAAKNVITHSSYLQNLIGTAAPFIPWYSPQAKMCRRYFDLGTGEQNFSNNLLFFNRKNREICIFT